jgi:hypothetical protein
MRGDRSARQWNPNAGVPAFPASPGDHFAAGFQLSNSQKSAIVLLPGTYGTSSEATLYGTHPRADASANAAGQARSATFTFLGFP